MSFDGRTSLSLTERKCVLVEGVRIPELDEIHKRVRHIWLSKEKKKKLNATERHRMLNRSFCYVNRIILKE